MKNNCTNFRLSLVSVALVTAYGGAWAADEVTEFSKPDSSISVGVGNWSGDRPQQGSYDGAREQGAFGMFDANVSRRNDETGTWYKFDGKNLGLESREFRIDLERQGDVGGYLEYNKTPRDYPMSVLSPQQRFGASNPGIVTTANAPKGSYSLGTTREAVTLGGFKTLAPGLQLKLSFKNEDKEGTRPFGYSGGSSFLAEPINSTIRQLDATLQFSGEKLQLSGGYYGSWFDQNNGGMLSISRAGSTEFVSQPLSNQAHQLFADGGYAFTPSTRGTFKVAFTRATQDENLPTYDAIGSANRETTAPTHLNGKVETSLLQFGLTSRPIKDLTVAANLRYHDSQDKTPIYKLDNTKNIYTTPQSLSKLTGKLEATYRLPYDFSLTGGIEHVKQNRFVPSIGYVTVPYRSELNETSYRLQLRRSMTETVSGSVAYIVSERDGSSVTLSRDASGNPIATQNRYNPIHISDRKRDKIRASVDWEATERLGLQFALEGAKDEYGPTRNIYGVTDGSAWLMSVDGTYSLSDSWKLTAWFSREELQTKETVASTVNNRVTMGEVTQSLGFGVKGNVMAKLKLGADVEWTNSDSRFGQTGSYTNRTLVPDVKSNLTRFKLNGTYALAKNQDIRLDYMHERWNSNDWNWSFANGSGFTFGDNTTVFLTPKQANNFVAARYIYKFQ